ncbi:type IV pilin protein [Halomonas sp. HK25]|uniref:type IV pilin protein n=1 Tax=Halomonas sp. HK25 TaxID=3394321 RepID=UPI0039FD9B25
MTQPSTRRRPQGPAGSTRRTAGFTLIELMIAVAIVGILASIAYPSYQRYVLESRRTDAKSSLMQVAGQLERCYTVTSDYRYRDGDGNACINFPIDSNEGFYRITASAADGTGTVPESSNYRLTATTTGAQNSSQSGDSCDDFTLTHTGARGANETDCW